jgi:hypothetical protein
MENPYNHVELYERVAALEAQMQGIQKEIVDARQDIKQLLELANKSKGAMWAYGSLYATAGGVISWLIGHFIGKP